MNIKKIAGVVAGAVFALGLSAPASAVVLTAGDLKITINAYDAGTVGYGNTDGVVCLTVGACDSAAALPAPNGNGSEDTWGIFSVASITNITTGQYLFTAGAGGKYLTGVFGGIVDAAVEVTGSISKTTKTYGTGGWLRMFETSQNYNASIGPSGRIGVDGYQGISNAPGAVLALEADFAGAVLQGLPYTYSSSFANQGYAGEGQGFLDVTGGTWADLLDTNSQLDANGNARDLALKVTYSGMKNGPWTVDATGDVQGAAGEVPEPASLALFGLGLAGLAALRRRRA